MSEREYSKSVHLIREHHKILKRNALDKEISIEQELREVLNEALECEEVG